MTETLPCLLRIGDNVKKYKIFKLDREQVTIGRSGDVTYAILSNMISRCHAIIKQQEKSWTITDNKSLNGVYVNGRQLTAQTPYTLQDGDMVQFGVPTSPNVPAEFLYKFYSSLKVRIEKKVKKLKLDKSEDQDKATLSFSESSDGDSSSREHKRKIPHGQGGEASSPSKTLKDQMRQSQAEQAAKEAEYQSRLAEMETLLKEKEKEQMEVQNQLERERVEKENQAREVEELRLKETAILQQMEEKQRELEREKEELKHRMQNELEASLKEREAALMSQLNAQKDALIKEKVQIEESLQKEKAKALEKDKELETNLMEQKEQLDKVLEKKEMEQKVLEAQLNEIKEKSESHALKAKEEVLSNFVDLMEMELQCSICNELFIKATSLNCSHTFCKLCINRWMKVKKECPNCRKAITSQMQAIALDSYIDKMVEQLNEELKQRRTELVAQRKVEQQKFDGLLPGPSRIATTTQPAPTGAALRGLAPHVAIHMIPTALAPGRGAPAVRGGAVAPAGRGTRQSTRSTRGRGRGRGGVVNPVVARTIAQAQAIATILMTGPAQTTGTTLMAAPPPVPPPAPAPVSTQGATSTSTATPPASSSTPHATTSSEVSTTSSSAPDIATVIELSDDDDDDDDANDVDVMEDLDHIFDEDVANNNADENSSQENSDSSELEGDEDAYFGGYGRCYSCGRRGHWANGCPY